MTDCIDLHLHTSHSDGTDTPAELVTLVRQLKLVAFAITDHDSVDAYLEARQLLAADDPELVPGIEISAGEGGEDIHILGYYIDPASDALNRAIMDFRKQRNQRGAQMLKKLKDVGINVPPEMIQQIAGKSAIARPHVADALVRIGAVYGYDDAFRRFLGNGRPAYVPKENIGPQDAIALIHEAGGLAFLAHPAVCNTIRYLDEFIGYGLDGIEAYHSKHGANTRDVFIKIAGQKGLLVSGGTDYHGRNGRYGMIGTQPVPLEYLDAMKKKLKRKNR
ncbi:MAG: PHP domain-containing protein [Candidatus Zixiibacteriota bacterium]|nr:MAG: PHP domain-containing protein [candidate division Zixibacteria bacterium]